MNELRRKSPLPDHYASEESLGSRWIERDPMRGPEGAYKGSIRTDLKKFSDSWTEVFTNPRHSIDILAGLTVAAVALPLNVALAVSVKLPPETGIIASAVGGMVAAIFGGSMLQVTGPSAAMAVLISSLVVRFGAAGAMAGALVVGLMQMIFFFSRAGGLGKYVPAAVLGGFTTGVGLKLLDLQIPHMLDVEFELSTLITNLSDPIWLNEVNWFAVLCGLCVISFVLGLSRYPKIPAAILGIALATAVSSYLDWDLIRVGAIPATFPSFTLPNFAWDEYLDLMILCIPLAILASTESLLSARAIDQMRDAKVTHAPNQELFGQSLANIANGLFGGIPVSGVIVRGTINVQSGARTRLASITHALILLVVPVYGAYYLGLIPIAALAGLLCLIGYRLIEFGLFFRLLKENKVGALAFALAAIGMTTGNLIPGLLSAGIVAGLGDWVKARAKRQLELKRKKLERPALPAGIRAKIPNEKVDHFHRSKPGTFHLPEEDWEAHINRDPVIHPTAFVHGNASVVGHVILGPGVHVATEAALRADEGTPFYVGRDTNIQDGVVLHALKGQWVEVGDTKYAIYLGERVSLAHQSLVHGPSFVGDETFVGFKAIVHNSVVGKGCFIGHGAIVVGVEIPDGKQVPPGAIIDTMEKAQALQSTNDGQRHFNEDVVGVNTGLANAYHSCCAPRPRPQLQEERTAVADKYPKLIQSLNEVHPHARAQRG